MNNMDHGRIKEMLQLYIMKELNPTEEEIILNHVFECDECRYELKSLASLYKALCENKPVVPENLQAEAERNLKLRLQESEAKSPIKKIIDDMYEFLAFEYRTVFAGAFTLVVGMFLGYLFFYRANAEATLPERQRTINLSQMDDTDLQISNIRFINAFDEGNQVEFDFDAVKPVSYKGDIADEFTQRLLAAAILNTKNAGIQIKTLNSLAFSSEKNFIPDEKVKKALITSLKIDDNPGVRREALNVLSKFPMDDDIKEVLLYVLSHDSNSGLRVAAINALVDRKMNDVAIDDEIKNVLNKKVENDPNEYVKIRAASLLEEVK